MALGGVEPGLLRSNNLNHLSDGIFPMEADQVVTAKLPWT